MILTRFWFYLERHNLVVALLVLLIELLLIVSMSSFTGLGICLDYVWSMIQYHTPVFKSSSLSCYKITPTLINPWFFFWERMTLICAGTACFARWIAFHHFSMCAHFQGFVWSMFLFLFWISRWINDYTCGIVIFLVVWIITTSAYASIGRDLIKIKIHTAGVVSADSYGINSYDHALFMRIK